MATEVSICNQALSWLGGDRIISLNDGTTEANLCKDNYPDLRDAVLSEGAWTFATKRFVPAASTVAPAYGYSTAFPMPTEVLTVIEVQRDSQIANGANDLDWRFENGAILCDEAVIYVKAIIRITDVTRFSPLFVQALAARIAADIAVPLTQNRRMQADMFALYDNKLDSAMFIDGSQGRSSRLRARQYQDVR